MPIFEYQCSKCGKVIEVLENSSESKKHTCPGCGRESMKKILSSFGMDSGGSSAGSSSTGGGSCPTGTCPF